MHILNIKTLRGPNYWSNYRQNLIVLELDLKSFEKLPTNHLPGFTEQLITLLPSLKEHHCSLGKEGGFIERLEQGTWLGHVIEHVALELQHLAGMSCHFGRTRSARKKGIYYVVFEYEIANAGLYAGHAAVKIVSNLARSRCLDTAHSRGTASYPFLEKDLAELKKIHADEDLGPSTKAIVNEAKKRHIPYKRLDRGSLIQFGQGCNQRIISATLTDQTSCLAVDWATDKDFTKQLLAAEFIPVPRGIVITTQKRLQQAIEQLHYPLVIKPINGNHGRGITTEIDSKEKAIAAFKLAKKISDEIIVEQFIPRSDYRFLVINYKFVAVAKRLPAAVTGDGISTINELINKTNQDPSRGESHENFLTKIIVDKITLSILSEKGLSLKSVLANGETVNLKHAANISSGGTAFDVTDKIHPFNIFLVERIARLLRLDICGIDIIAKNIGEPLTTENGAVIEVNAAPGIRLHLSPTEGKSHNVAKEILDLLYPQETSARIPIVAITGTNGKTTSARLIAYFASQAGYQVGLTTTDGIFINNVEIHHGDSGGPLSADIILRDPLINFAVLECARGGILRSGLGFDKCNISIVTNISEDHLGLEGIETLEDLARVKSVVPRSTFNHGYAILNADDDLVYDMKHDVHCNIALFSKEANNERIKQHSDAGGLAAFIKNNNDIMIIENKIQTCIAKISDLAITHYGVSRCIVQNILPALLAGRISGFTATELSLWLNKFSPTNIPGRMNLFTFTNYQVLLDYAHNIGAYVELQKYLQQVKQEKIIGIIGVPGDRRNEDIIKIGYYSAQMFDEIVIRHDEDGRGRTNEEITKLLMQGIKSSDPSLQVSVISNELLALQTTMQNAKKDTFIVYLPENVFLAIDYLSELTRTNTYET